MTFRPLRSVGLGGAGGPALGLHVGEEGLDNELETPAVAGVHVDLLERHDVRGGSEVGIQGRVRPFLGVGHEDRGGRNGPPSDVDHLPHQVADDAVADEVHVAAPLAELLVVDVVVGLLDLPHEPRVPVLQEYLAGREALDDERRG